MHKRHAAASVLDLNAKKQPYQDAYNKWRMAKADKRTELYEIMRQKWEEGQNVFHQIEDHTNQQVDSAAQSMSDSIDKATLQKDRAQQYLREASALADKLKRKNEEAQRALEKQDEPLSGCKPGLQQLAGEKRFVRTRSELDT